MTDRERFLFSALVSLIAAIVIAGVLASEGVAGIVAVFGSLSLIGVAFATRPRAFEWRPPPLPDPAGESPRALLERRLAAGEIDTDEFLERESALRDATRH